MQRTQGALLARLYYGGGHWVVGTAEYSSRPPSIYQFVY